MKSPICFWLGSENKWGKSICFCLAVEFTELEHRRGGKGSELRDMRPWSFSDPCHQMLQQKGILHLGLPFHGVSDCKFMGLEGFSKYTLPLPVFFLLRFCSF